jgi:hypothetical protein
MDLEKEDEQLLAKNGRDITEITELLESRIDRAEADRRMAMAQAGVDEKQHGTVFHNGKTPMRHHSSNLFKLSEAIELYMKANRHGADLQRSLDNHLRQRIKILHRIMKRV